MSCNCDDPDPIPGSSDRCGECSGQIPNDFRSLGDGEENPWHFLEGTCQEVERELETLKTPDRPR
ncbi:MAG: hypothetical protein ABEJ02_01980 [Candidatus Paceibacteria bacterium]